MAANSESKDRQVVPRWRSFRATLVCNELGGASLKSEPAIDGSAFLLQKEIDYQENGAMPFALDLVCAASVLGTTALSRKAAEFILQNEGRASHTGKSLALAHLGLERKQRPATGPQTRTAIIEGLKELKRNRINQARNAFVWVDLARLYTLLGQNIQAWGALEIALKLAPSDRFVLRSAARFLHHTREYDQAVELLRRSGRTPEDPWLLAAEIAASGVAEKSPRFAKVGVELLTKGGWSPFHTSELASALATLDMTAGKHRSANRLFVESLRQPTHNALAQAVWATKKAGVGHVNVDLLNKERAVEALTLDHFNKGDWKEVVVSAEKWAEEEGFSARPPGLASSVASSMLDKPEDGEAIAQKGLETNPHHPALINNKAFSQILQGKVWAGISTLQEIVLSSTSNRDRVCLLATTGLANFRLGREVEGRKFYETAIHLANEIDDIGLKTLASLYLAREEAARGKKEAVRDFKRAYAMAEKLQQTHMPAYAEHLAKDVEQAAARMGVQLELRKHPKPIIVDGDLFLPRPKS